MTYGDVVQAVFYMVLLGWSLVLFRRALDTRRLREQVVHLEEAVKHLTIENARLRGDQ